MREWILFRKREYLNECGDTCILNIGMIMATDYGRWLLMFKKLYIDKLITAIIILNLAEIATIAVIFVLGGITGSNMQSFSGNGVLIIVLSALAAMIINTLAAISNRSTIHRTHSDFILVKDTLSRLENLNTTLRSQRHDFMNHLQVVYSLMEMEEYPSARDYIEKVYSDIQKVSRVMKTSSPAVNALLQAKIPSCEKKGIHVSLEVTTQLKEMSMPAWEFCRVLGNIIDNAVYALEEGKKADMQLGVSLFEDIRSFGFKISDNGGGIPAEVLDRIFEPGFTTKGDSGEGMGLAISRDLLKKYGGWLRVRCGDGITEFEGYVPK